MEGKQVTIKGCEIYYVEKEETVRSAQPPRTVVFVHGNLGSCRWFSRVMDIPGFRTIALDMPNFGRSGRIESHDIPSYVEYVTAFIREVVGAPVVLVGHSLGGSVAMGIACAEPKLVEALMLVDPAPVDGLVTPPEHYPAIEAYRQDEAQLRVALKTVVPTMDDEVWFNKIAEDARMMKGEAYVGHAEALGRADYTDVAGNYTGPVLVIRGSQDWLVSAEMVERTAAAFGGKVKEVPTVGHSIMVEDPDLLTAMISEFLAEH